MTTGRRHGKVVRNGTGPSGTPDRSDSAMGFFRPANDDDQGGEPPEGADEGVDDEVRDEVRDEAGDDLPSADEGADPSP
jgi:hypothetical protein